MAKRGDTRRFLEALASTPETACVPWPFAKLQNGYGAINYLGKVTGAHRVMCMMAYGPPPTATHCALHSCGRGHEGCVNPRHLRWGTLEENASDAAVHGTVVRGSKSNFAKLTEQDVIGIRALHAQGCHTQRQIARMYGISFPAMHMIVHRKNWAWLD